MSFSSYLQASRVMVVGARSPVDRRRRGLERVSKELSRGNYETALSLVKQLKAKHGCLPSFGSAKLLPKRLSVLDKLQVSELGSLIHSVSTNIESLSAQQNSVSTFKQDTTNASPEQDRYAILQHESGHFLVAYLLGVLPRHYEIPNLEALMQNVSNVTGRVEFVGFDFLKEVGAANRLIKYDVDGHGPRNPSGALGNISSKTLNNFSCVILGGIVTEHVLFGYSEGLYSDVDKLNSVLQWQGLTDTEKEAHIRWAACNTVSLLHSYSEARASLAEAMGKAKPIGACIEAIESAISRHQI